jgi:hypothetical protein
VARGREKYKQIHRQESNCAIYCSVKDLVLKDGGGEDQECFHIIEDLKRHQDDSASEQLLFHLRCIAWSFIWGHSFSVTTKNNYVLFRSPRVFIDIKSSTSLTFEAMNVFVHEGCWFGDMSLDTFMKKFGDQQVVC